MPDGEGGADGFEYSHADGKFTHVDVRNAQLVGERNLNQPHGYRAQVDQNIAQAPPYPSQQAPPCPSPPALAGVAAVVGGAVLARAPGGAGGRVIVGLRGGQLGVMGLQPNGYGEVTLPAGVDRYERWRGARERDLDPDRDRDRERFGDRARGQPAPIASSELSSLITSIRAEGFSENKLRVLTAAAPLSYFLVEQVAELLPLFGFVEERLKALAALQPQILDRRNAFRLYRLFPFSSEKDSARRILERPPQG